MACDTKCNTLRSRRTRLTTDLCRNLRPHRERTSTPSQAGALVGRQLRLIGCHQHASVQHDHNFAQRSGLAYQVDFKHGLLKRLTGNPGQTGNSAGGYAIAYDREGLNLTDSVFGANFGGTTDLSQFAGSPTGFPRGTLALEHCHRRRQICRRRSFARSYAAGHATEIGIIRISKTRM